MKVISSFAERLRIIKEEKGSLEDLARLTGVPKQTLHRYIQGERVPKITQSAAIAEKLGVNPLWLNGFDVERYQLNIAELSPVKYAELYPDFFEKWLKAQPSPTTVRIPVLGVIRAGEPMLAEQNIIEYINLPAKFCDGDGNCFGLKVVGDSMNAARIMEGDMLVIRQQPNVENGEIAVVLVDGEDATVKRFYKTETTVTLMPSSTNPAHQPRIIDTTKTEVKVLGKVVKNLIDF